MPSQEPLVPGWFEDVEATLDSYEVPHEWRAGLVLPRLSEKARGLLTRLSAEQRKSYAELKGAVLKGLRLSAAEYRRLFAQSKRRSDETWAQFTTRLENYLIYYMQSCKVTTIERFRELVVADRLRESLGHDARTFIIQNEKAGEALTPPEMADLAESFEESIREKSSRGTGTPARVYGGSGETLKQRSTEANQRVPDNVKRCFLCRSPTHMARNCPSAGARQANQVQVEGVDDILVARVEGVELNIEGSMRPAIAVKTQELQKPQIVILSSGHRMFTENVDSGAEISVVRRSLVPDYQPSGSKIRMTGAFGQQVTADLAYVPLRLRDEPQYVTYGPDEVGILCAVTDKLARGIDVLLTPDAYEQLLERTAQMPELDTNVEVLKLQEREDGQARFKMDEVITEAIASAVQCGRTGDAPDVGERAGFRDSQMKDPTLKEGWNRRGQTPMEWLWWMVSCITENLLGGGFAHNLCYQNHVAPTWCA
ncbi:unnamed protein product [Ixodes pacificus]